ncbi:hypothetical protein C8Q77DRAFT_1160041 [Trametes polyzona]|nr:hypothetical protein C8Q77DRAFT_1160041 [Trametes polyzona]
MSSGADAGPGVAEIIDIYQSVFTVSSFQFCVVAFLLYDYLITLDREIELFWRRKFSGPSALFFFTRYSTLIAYDFLGTATLSHLSDTRYVYSTLRETLFTLNVLDLILNQISVVTPYHTASYITILSDPLTAVLVYRFLLDLQAANLASIELRSSALPSIAVDPTATGAGGSTLRFASHIVEPFGTSLLPGATPYGSADDQLSDHEYDAWDGGQTGPDGVEDAAHAEAAAQVPNLKQGGAGDIELSPTAGGEEMEGGNAALPSAW